MKKLLLFIALTIFGLGLNAQYVGDETTIDYDGYSLKFKITSVEPAECKVSGRTGSPTEVTIPSTVTISGTEFNVTSIGDWAFHYCSSLTSIEIPSSVTFIYGSAFESCSSLRNVTFEENSQLTSIGSYAFSYCSSLTSIEIPNSVTSIGRAAFSFCSSLTSIEIPNSVTSIGSIAFSYCSSLTSIVVAEGNTVYDSRENCNAIIETTSNTLIYGFQNTVIPNSVTSIGDCAFGYCSSLTSIEIPNSVTSIGKEAFRNCSSLKVIKCHAENVPETGSGVFSFCSYGVIICVPENSVEDYKAEHPWNNYYITAMSEISVIEYDGYSLIYIITDEENTECMVACAQEPTMPTSITIPSSVEIKGIEYFVTSIGSGAFESCSSLTSIEIPNSVTSIGDDAFYYCKSLTSITFGDNPQLTSIGDRAFYGCSSLTSIEIPNSVTSIGEDAFYYCTSLASVTFEENSQLTSIGDYAFYDCYSLTSIEIPNSVTSIGDDAFNYCSSLTSMIVAEGNTVYDSRENSNAIIETTSNTLIYGCQNTVIPNTVTTIGNSAFIGCSSLTSIEIPNSVTSIEALAFVDCSSLTSIEIPNSVTFIGDYAFYYCSSLRVITCYAENIPETGDYVFDYCPSDMIIYVPEVSLEDYKSASPWNAFTILSLNEGPRNIIATTDSAFSVNLSWDNCYADSYNVYRNGDSIANVTNPTYTDIDLEYNTEYCYTVTAVRNETESDKSEEVCAKTLDLPITTPTNIVAEALSTSSISLSWNEVENALSYNVYQANELIANIEETTFTIDSLEYNTEYCYTVTAVRNETESDKSEEKCVKTLDLPITTPENLVAEALSTSSIILAWDNVENALSYNVYRDGEMIINVTNTNYTDKDLEYNTEYCYTVTAVRNETESDKSEEKCVKTLGESINELSSSINIYPNPVENDLFIATEVRVEEIAIYDIYGRQTMSQQVNETTSQQVVEVADLEAGVYFVNVKTENGNIVKRFVKK